jgi:tetratricopeptide (TPR) repeat protein
VRKMAVRLLAVVFALDVFYAVNYDIPDIDAHYTPAFIAGAFLMAFGLQFLFRKRVRRPLLLLGAAVMVIPLAFNYHICDMSKNRIAYEYGENHLKSIDSDGLCLSSTWDLYSVILYMKHVEGKRRDVVMINKGLLRASWYFDYLKREYPATYGGSEREIESYLEELTKLERRTGGDLREMQRRFIVMGNSLLENHMRSGPIYTTFVNGQGMDTPEIGKRFRKIPHGIVFEFTEDGQAAPFDWSSLELSSSFGARIHKDQRMRSDLAHYPIMMFLSGTALMEAGMYADAKTAFENALAIEPQNLYARLHLGRAELMLGQYDEAIWAFEAVLQKDPRNELALQGIRTARSELGME